MAESATAYLLRTTEREMREAWSDLCYYRKATRQQWVAGNKVCIVMTLDNGKITHLTAELRTLARVRRVLKGRTR